jgi:four helix bundle protein
MSKEIRNHKDLEVWEKVWIWSVIFTKLPSLFPTKNFMVLTNQIRRAAVSIPSNIAEGAARNSKKEFIQFLYIALGSLSELETQIIIANRLEYLNNLDTLLEDLKFVQKLINGLIYYLKK